MKKYYISLLILSTTTLILVFLKYIINLNYTLKDFFSDNNSIVFILTTNIILLIYIVLNKPLKNIPISHNIAIIGFPQSGKTTLISTMIGEVMEDKIKQADIVLKGDATIERINENLKKIKQGLPIGATTDETKFAYRTNISIKNELFIRNYKIEYGDFPGELSKEMSCTNINWLKHTEFFRWALEADCYIFTIDITVLSYKEELIYNVNDVITGYRAAWQHIIDNNTEPEIIVRRRPIIIVFTKCDEYINTLHNISMRYSSSIDPTAESFVKFEKNMIEIFSPLINFLKKSNPKTKVVFTSSFDEGKLGVKELFVATLPKHKSFLFSSPFLS